MSTYCTEEPQDATPFSVTQAVSKQGPVNGAPNQTKSPWFPTEIQIPQEQQISHKEFRTFKTHANSGLEQSSVLGGILYSSMIRHRTETST